MVFNLPDRYMLLLNGLLVGVVAIFLALNVSDVVKLRLAANAVPSEPETAAASGRSPLLAIGIRPRALYDAITQRDIFNLTPAPESAPAENEDLQVKLLGTSQLSSGKPFAIIENQSGDQSLYRLGDTIPGAGQLLEVSRDRVVVLHNGRRVALTIPRIEGQPDRGRPSGRAARRRPYSGPSMIPRPGMFQRPRAGVRQLGPNRYVLDRSAVNSNLQNLAPLFTQIRAIPNLRDGNSNGFRLSEIQPGSIFQQIGLQDGDVLTSVSGQAVTDPLKAMALLQTLRDRPAISLDLMRHGASVQLYYNIR
jgi:general secretion pathway protein C